ncbi:hypothetical protein F5887DRAFT_505813 [Amanita rubescens]|nr:hypothetical protein F5887DRAFT_505813 [Amanita rubescens]
MIRLWQRTSALQCCPRQGVVNAMIPMYFDLADLPLSQRMSEIFISVGNTKRSNRHRMDTVQREGASIDCSSDLPWIAILADYGLEESKWKLILLLGATTTKDKLLISVCESMQQERVAILSNSWIKDSVEYFGNSSTLKDPFGKGTLSSCTSKTEWNSGALRK